MSFDLIYARPARTACGLGFGAGRGDCHWPADHLSLYQADDRGRHPFYGLHKAGKLIVPDGELSAETL